jgi:hypothetical protein
VPHESCAALPGELHTLAPAEIGPASDVGVIASVAIQTAAAAERDTRPRQGSFSRGPQGRFSLTDFTLSRYRYIESNTSAYFSLITLRLTFSVGVSSPVSCERS